MLVRTPVDDGALRIREVIGRVAPTRRSSPRPRTSSRRAAPRDSATLQTSSPSTGAWSSRFGAASTRTTHGGSTIRRPLPAWLTERSSASGSASPGPASRPARSRRTATRGAWLWAPASGFSMALACTRRSACWSGRHCHRAPCRSRWWGARSAIPPRSTRCSPPHPGKRSLAGAGPSMWRCSTTIRRCRRTAHGAAPCSSSSWACCSSSPVGSATRSSATRARSPDASAARRRWRAWRRGGSGSPRCAARRRRPPHPARAPTGRGTGPRRHAPRRHRPCRRAARQRDGERDRGRAAGLRAAEHSCPVAVVVRHGPARCLRRRDGP